MVTQEDAELAYQEAMINLAQHNRTTTGLKHKFNAHTVTNNTGLGILGQTQNLAKQEDSQPSCASEYGCYEQGLWKQV